MSNTLKALVLMMTWGGGGGGLVPLAVAQAWPPGGDVVDPSATPVSIMAHVQNVGWIGPFISGQVAGTVGSSLRLEAVMIRAPYRHICYQAHVQNIGWMTPVCDGAVAGTVGQSLRMEALRIWAEHSHVVYYAHVQNIGWTGPFQDAAVAGTTGQSLSMEAVSIRISDLTTLDLPQIGGETTQDVGADVDCGVTGTFSFPFSIGGGETAVSKDFQSVIWLSDPFYRLFGQYLNAWITIKNDGTDAGTYDDGSLRVEVTRQVKAGSLAIYKYPDHVYVSGRVTAIPYDACGGHLWVRVSLRGQYTTLQLGPVPLAQPPAVSPPSIRASVQGGTVEGSVSGIDSYQNYKVIVYARTDAYYIQPCITEPISTIGSNGIWGPVDSHNGDIFAILVRNGYSPLVLTSSLPTVDGVTVLAATGPSGTIAGHDVARCPAR